MSIRYEETWGGHSGICMLVGILGFVVVGPVVGFLITWPFRLMWPAFMKAHSWIWFLAVIVSGFGWVFTVSQWTNAISAYQYIRGHLKTKVSFSEARKLSWLFVPNKTGKWWPMKEIRDLPTEIRRTVLFQTAESIRVSLSKSAR